VLRAGETARILVVGQAPGDRVYTTGFAWATRVQAVRSRWTMARAGSAKVVSRV